MELIIIVIIVIIIDNNCNKFELNLPMIIKRSIENSWQNGGIRNES